MRTLILLAIMMPSIAFATPPAGQKCDTGIDLTKRDSAEPLKVRPLAQEPNAAELLAVYRRVDGCARPVVLRNGVGKKGSEQPKLRTEPQGLPLQ